MHASRLSTSSCARSAAPGVRLNSDSEVSGIHASPSAPSRLKQNGIGTTRLLLLHALQVSLPQLPDQPTDYPFLGDDVCGARAVSGIFRNKERGFLRASSRAYRRCTSGTFSATNALGTAKLASASILSTPPGLCDYPERQGCCSPEIGQSASYDTS